MQSQAHVSTSTLDGMGTLDGIGHKAGAMSFWSRGQRRANCKGKISFYEELFDANKIRV